MHILTFLSVSLGQKAVHDPCATTSSSREDAFVATLCQTETCNSKRGGGERVVTCGSLRATVYVCLKLVVALAQHAWCGLMLSNHCIRQASRMRGDVHLKDAT